MFAYADSGTTCSICDVDHAINTALEEKDDTFQDLMTRLTINQKSLLIAMAHADKDFQPTSGSFIKKYKLSSTSSVQRSMNALQEKDLITNVNGRYSIYDYFLELWLKSKF